MQQGADETSEYQYNNLVKVQRSVVNFFSFYISSLVFFLFDLLILRIQVLSFQGYHGYVLFVV